MKKVLLITLVLMMVVGMAGMAEAGRYRRGTASSSKDTSLFYGTGLDFLLYESDDILKEVNLEARYEMEQDNTTIFLVGKINLFKLFKKAK